jgi:beta-glucosidase
VVQILSMRSQPEAIWDREYMDMYSKALGEEYYGKGANVALGPVGGPIGRMVRGGRNWEGPSPYISGVQM